MSHGFDLNSPLICEGIIGDGCGGGRLFLVKNETLMAYDPQTKEKRVLLKTVMQAQMINKSGCLITIKCLNETVKFDLSALKKV